MNVSNGIPDDNDGTHGEPSSSPPPSSPSADVNESLQAETNAASSGDKPEGDEQPIVIASEFLPAVVQMVESLGPRRVKVYELRGEVWVDLGTGFCQGYVENVGSLYDHMLMGLEYGFSEGYK
jgi:hypothetical protein